MKIMVAYDGTLQAKEALVYGIEKARTKGGEVIALQVFNSPLFVDYDATVNARTWQGPKPPGSWKRRRRSSGKRQRREGELLQR